MQPINIQSSVDNICMKHGCIKEAIPYHESFVYWSCPKCEEEQELKAIEKEIQENMAKQEELDRLAFKCIPKKFRNARLSNFNNILPIIKYVSNPEGFLFIFGNCGTGKTHLATAIQYHHNVNNLESKLIFSSDLFVKLRNSFTKGESTEVNLIESATVEHLVIFDDIGAQKLSDYAIEAWYDIIDKRYREESPTIFTSNLNLSEISKCMNDRMASRLSSGVVFKLEGQDRRCQ